MTKTSEASPRRSRPWRRLLLIALGLVVVLVAAAAILLPRFLDVERYRERIEAAVEEGTGLEAELGAIELSVWRGLALTVSPAGLKAPEGNAELDLTRLEVRARTLPLLRGRLEIVRIVLVGPEIRLVRRSEEEGWPLPLPPVPEKGEGEGKGKGGGLAVSVEEIRVRDGRLLLEDRSGAGGSGFEISDLDMSLYPGRGQVSGSAELAGGGSVDWSGSSAEGLSFELEGLRTEMLHAWVSEDLLLPGGLLSGQVRLALPLDIQGRIEGREVLLLDGKSPFERAAVDFHLRDQGGTWLLEKLDLTAGKVRATAKGTLLPAVGLDVELPRTPLKAALEAAESVLPVPLELDPPGEVLATIRVDQPAGGAIQYEARGGLAARRFLPGPTLPPIEDLKATFVLDRRGQLVIDVLEGRAAGGPVRGVARLSSVAPPGQMTFEGGLKDAVLGQLLEGLVPEAGKKFFGATAVNARVGLDLGRETLDARALSGRLEIDSREVSAPGWDLEAALMKGVADSLGGMSSLAGMVDPDLARTLEGGGDPSGRLLDMVQGAVSFDTFPWTIEKLSLQSSGFRARGQGTYDPLANKVRLDFSARLDERTTRQLLKKSPALKGLVDGKGRLTVPMSIRGPLVGPSIGLDVQKAFSKGLKDQAVDEATDSLLRKLGGD
jgi:uncharacterized protein YhdP